MKISGPVAVVGHTQCGKSTLLRSIITEPDSDRVLAIEHDERKRPEWEALGFMWYPSFGELFADFDAVRPRRFRVVVAPGRERFVDTLRLAMVLGDVLVPIEEMTRYFPWSKRERAPHHMPVVWGRNMFVPGEFMELCVRWAHQGMDSHRAVGLIGVTQQPILAPKCFRAELVTTYALHLADEDDRKWLRGVPGGTRETADQTKDLPKYRYFEISRDDGIKLQATTP